MIYFCAYHKLHYSVLLHRIQLTLQYILYVSQIRSGTLRQDNRKGGGTSQCYSLEVSGPVLPSNYQRLIRLLGRAHREFSASFSTMEDSTAFNSAPIATSEDSQCHPLDMGKQATRQMSWDEKGFHWTNY